MFQEYIQTLNRSELLDLLSHRGLPVRGAGMEEMREIVASKCHVLVARQIQRKAMACGCSIERMIGYKKRFGDRSMDEMIADRERELSRLEAWANE